MVSLYNRDVSLIGADRDSQCARSFCGTLKSQRQVLKRSVLVPSSVDVQAYEVNASDHQMVRGVDRRCYRNQRRTY
jgi:hypothetical protein